MIEYREHEFTDEQMKIIRETIKRTWNNDALTREMIDAIGKALVELAKEG